MAKKGLTEIVAIIDKSGSMYELKSRTIEGFNSFLKEQKEVDGEANFSLILFSSPNHEEIIFDSVDIQEVEELNENNYSCRGVTALYDAIGKTIKALKKRIKNMDESERPERVLFVILTDGEENSSHYYDKEKVFKMIKKREEKFGWAFLYLGANQDAFAEGGKIGVKRGRTLNYAATDDGLNFAYSNISNYTKAYRMSADLETANNLSFDDANNTDKNTGSDGDNNTTNS